MVELQTHLIGRPLVLPKTRRELHGELRKQLLDASDRGAVTSSPAEILKQIKLLDNIPGRTRGQLEPKQAAGAFVIVGGEKDFKRTGDKGRFERDDGAWFDFTLTARETNQGIELLGYDIEIRFPPGTGIPFLRFDLNLPGHSNEERDQRSHLHAGNDDVLIPAPVMSPRELLTLFIHGLRAPRTKQRSPTDFEVRWLSESHRLASAP